MVCVCVVLVSRETSAHNWTTVQPPHRLARTVERVQMDKMVLCASVLQVCVCVCVCVCECEWGECEWGVCGCECEVCGQVSGLWV